MINLEKDRIKEHIDNCNTIEELSERTNIMFERLEVEIIKKYTNHYSVFDKFNNLDITRFYNQISNTLLDYSPISDISNILITDMFEDDHEMCIELIFSDENHNRRFGQIMWNPYGPGMVHYSNCCKEAKNDLIAEINKYYKIINEEEQTSNCISCRQGPIAYVCAKCKDLCNWICEDKEYDGYVIREEIGNGKYIEFSYCLNCGKIQYDYFPVSK